MKPNRHLRLWIIAAVAVLLAAFLGRTQLFKRSAHNPSSDTHSSVPIATSAVEPSEIATRRERRINLAEVSLAHVAAHFAAQSGRKITVAPEIAKLKLSGTLEIDNVDTFLRLLPRAMPVRLELGSDGSVQILPNAPR